MSIITYPLNGITYDADDAQTYLCTRTSGVFSSEDCFELTITDDLEITISPGLAWIKNTDYAGKSVCSNADVALSVSPGGSLPRTDRVVLRFSKSDNASELAILEGTESSSYPAPELTQEELVYELGLYEIYVGAETTSIEDDDITDTRADDTVCGIMHDGVTSAGNYDDAGSVTVPVYWEDGFANCFTNNITALGLKASASNANSTVYGYNATESGTDATAYGCNAAAAINAVAIGCGASAPYSSSIAIGKNITANGVTGIGIGCNISIEANGTVCIGHNTVTNGTSSLALGSAANADAGYSMAFGYKAEASAENAIAFGYKAEASAENAMALGYNAAASANRSIAAGENATASADNAIALGINANASANNAIVLGTDANASADNSIALGTGATVSAENSSSIAIGNSAAASANYAIAIGQNVVTGGIASVAIGTSINTSSNQTVSISGSAEATSATAVGYSADATGQRSTAIGSIAQATYGGAVALGASANATANNAVALGMYANAISKDAIALGNHAYAGLESNFADPGDGSLEYIETDEEAPTAIGWGACANFANCLAIGTNAYATSYNSVAIGPNSYCSTANAIQLGSEDLSYLRCKVSLSTTSDIRDKTDIEDFDDGATEFLKSLKAIRFVFNSRESYIDVENLSDEDKEKRSRYGLCTYDTEAHEAGTKKGSRMRGGVSAQEVQAALESVYGDSSYTDLVNDNLYDFDPDEIPDDVESKLAVNYSGFIPYLIKAFQELEARVASNEESIAALQSAEG